MVTTKTTRPTTQKLTTKPRFISTTKPTKSTTTSRKSTIKKTTIKATTRRTTKS